jgi:hypothetical protein
MKNILIILTFSLFACQNDFKSSKTEMILNPNQEFQAASKDAKGDYTKIISKLMNNDKSDKIVTFGNNQISSKIWENDNNFTKRYNYSKKTPKFYEFLPILSYFLPRNYENYEIIIVLDKNKNIIGIENFYNKIALKSSIFCKIINENCVYSIK